MPEVIRLTERHQVDSRSESDPFSRVAMIVEHANQLAEEATRAAASGSPPPVSVRGIIDARKARRRHFESDLFADPAWDILLELYALRCEQRRTSVSKLCMSIGVPTTTGLRWMDRLSKDGLIDRFADPLDARRVWVELSDLGLDAMTNYLQELADGMTAL